MSSKPLQVKDKVFYWQEDKSKIRSDGGIWLKGKVISIEGAMVGLDLGTRLIKVNVTKVRKDETIPRLLCRLSQNPQCFSRIAGKTTPKPAAPHPAENMFVEDFTSVPEQAHWNSVRKGKIHVLEIFPEHRLLIVINRVLSLLKRPFFQYNILIFQGTSFN